MKAPLAASAALAVMVSLSAQQSPVFRSRVDVVTVDVAVLDGSGRPIETLQPTDFELEVDGAPRRIISAQYVPYRTAAAEKDAPNDAPPLSNEHVATGRIILIAVDQGNIRRVEGRRALRAAASFVDTLDPADRVAAVSVDDVQPIHFTNDRFTVKRVLETFTGRAGPIGAELEFNLGISEAVAVSNGDRARLDQVVLRECGRPLHRINNTERVATDEGVRDPCPNRVEQQARVVAQDSRSQTDESLDSLRRLLRRLDDIEGPKTLVLLSEGLIAEPQRIDMTDIAALAQQARVTIYVLQLDVPAIEASERIVSPTHSDDLRARGDGLARIAGAGGGMLLQLVGADAQPFRRILQELSGYYLLAFEPTPGDRDGRPHRISVKTRRGATVRARPAFIAPAAPAAPLTTEDRLVQLLRTRRLATELPLRLDVGSVRGSDASRLQTFVTVETDGRDPDVTFGVVVVDEAGVIATSSTQRTTSGRYAFTAALAPGRYIVRAAGVEANGRIGSIERPLDAKLHGEPPVQTSDLFLTEAALTGGETAPRAVVDRTSAAALAVSIEIYAPRTWNSGRVTLELNGLGGAKHSVVADAIPRWNARGFWIARGDLSLADLPAGRYVVTAKVPGGVELKRALRVTR